MARRKNRALRIVGWIIFGITSFILLITLVFYLGRGWILNRAVTYLNDQQPGEVQMGQMNLIPFVNFPNVSLQLRNVSYYEKEVHPDSLLQEPILILSEVFVTLDAVDLIRGDIQVSTARMENGFVRMVVYEDSVTNLEYALGIRFGEETEKDSTTKLPAMKVDLDRIELNNIVVIMEYRTSDDRVNLTVNQLESTFSYLPTHVQAGLKLDIDVDHLKYLTYRVEDSRNIQFESEVIVDPVQGKIEVEPSSMKISELELETWGTYRFMGQPHLDFAFRASNEGLEVLNYLFRGILDLDEIEQIGSGSISLSGNINGYLGDQLPVLRINGSANQIGFRIKSIQKDITDISFKIYATNGNKLDLSEGLILVDEFTAKFPNGSIMGNLSVENMVSPKVNIDLVGDVGLSELEQILKNERFVELEGRVAIDCKLNGAVNNRTGEFFNDAGSLRAVLNDVGFVVYQDSGISNSVKHMNGELYMEENLVGAEKLSFEFNGNTIELGAKTENLLLYLLGFDGDVSADLYMASEVIDPASFIRDTSISGLLGDEWKALQFGASVTIANQELDTFIQEKTVPRMQIKLDSFGVVLPVYAKISNLDASLTFGPDTVELQHLSGNVGESEFKFSGLIANYSALKGKDSTAVFDVEYQISSDLMRAEEFLTFNDTFLLPEAYRTEYLKDFRLTGSMEVPVAGIIDDSASLDFNLNIMDLGWNFRYYPLPFNKFQAQIRRAGDHLFINDFQGMVGESNLKLDASVGNFTDTLIENMYGSLVLESDLLDLDKLLDYQMPEDLKVPSMVDTTDKREPSRLDQVEYPQFDFTVNVGELRFGEYKIFDLNGKLRTTREKVLYLDNLATSVEGEGKIAINGQLNVSNPSFYTFSTEFDLENIDINDLDFEMKSGEESYTLKENFKGLISAEGLGEIFITPDLKFDLANTTITFNVKVTNGELIEFTPLQAVAKYLNNKDLNHVKFATLQNSFPLTLADSRIIIPLTIVESTIGQMLIEGEQRLDKSYLYLMRLPTTLVRGAARSRLTGAEDDQEEDQIQEVKLGNFMKLTVWGDGEVSEVKLNDKREKYQ